MGRRGIEFSNWLWETPVYEDSEKYKKFLYFKNNILKDTKYYKFHKLNLLIYKMIKDGIPPKKISEELNIKRQTIYNLTRNNKNGRNTY